MQTNFSINNYQQNYSSYNQSFGAKGKPLDLKYIYNNRSRLLPDRVKEIVKNLISEGEDKGVSLLYIHKTIYEPILSCKTLGEVKELYPEFRDVLPMAQMRHGGGKAIMSENFGLKMLQEYWGNLKSKDEIAQMFGLKNRSSLGVMLKKINFVGVDTNYKRLLEASDEVGNRQIAQKTRDWNANNPEKRRELNKHAAQGCKTVEYRAAQAQRIIEYDKIHPERRQKISEHSTRMWDLCPEVRVAMSDYDRQQEAFFGIVLGKRARKEPLTQNERRMVSIFYKRFWNAHPELKENLSVANRKAKEE